MKTYDAVIIGGGIIGASLGYELAKKKLQTIILDRQEPGCEASCAAAGMLSPAPEGRDGERLAPLAKASLKKYPQFVTEIEAASGETTGFLKNGTLELFFPPECEKECNAAIAANRAHGLAIEAVSLQRVREMAPCASPRASAAAWLPDECSIDPRALTRAVLAAARTRGVEICAGIEVKRIINEGTRCAGVETSGEKISAKQVILAAGCFSAGIEGLAGFAPTRPVRGQMIALRPPRDALTCVLRSQRGYVVPREDGRVVAGSTLEDAGFEKRVTPAGILQILSSAVELAPSLADAEVLETWSGLRPDTPDHLPIIGPTHIEGLWMATGHYRNGILLAPVTAQCLSDWITTGEPGFNLEDFSPSRFARANSSVAR